MRSSLLLAPLVGLSLLCADRAGADPAATASPPKATTDKATTDPASTTEAREKHWISKGYKLEVRNGVRLFCHREELLGSRLGGEKVCATTDQLQIREEESQRMVEQVQRTQKNPNGG